MKTDYRFSKVCNPDYLPEDCECEACGDFVDNEHLYEDEGTNLCPDCFYKKQDERTYLEDGGMSL